MLVNNISGSTLEVEGITSGLSFDTRWEIRLGSLSLAWSTGPHTVPVSGTLVVPADIPEAAFLHAFAEDYLTDVSVRFEGADNGRIVARFRSAPLFLAWPDGEQGGAQLWDEATASIEAPNGIVDDTLRASLTGLGASRLLAPLWNTGVPEQDAVELREKGE